MVPSLKPEFAKMLDLHASTLRAAYLTLCDLPECSACNSRRIAAKEKFRDFRYALIDIVTGLDLEHYAEDHAGLSTFVMNYPFEVK